MPTMQNPPALKGAALAAWHDEQKKRVSKGKDVAQASDASSTSAARKDISGELELSRKDEAISLDTVQQPPEGTRTPKPTDKNVIPPRPTPPPEPSGLSGDTVTPAVSAIPAPGGCTNKRDDGQ